MTLTNQGYDVTIYEKEAQPGGWLRNGIPQFRLPQSVLDAEIARIEKMGVTIKCNNEIGKTLTPGAAESGKPRGTGHRRVIERFRVIAV
mgnify:CR=1 FL=1